MTSLAQQATLPPTADRPSQGTPWTPLAVLALHLGLIAALWAAGDAGPPQPVAQAMAPILELSALHAPSPAASTQATGETQRSPATPSRPPAPAPAPVPARVPPSAPPSPSPLAERVGDGAPSPHAAPQRPDPTGLPVQADPGPAAPPEAHRLAAPAPIGQPATAPPSPPGPASLPPTLSIRTVSYLTPPELQYPPAARRAQEEGRAWVRLLVDAAGQPQRATLERSSGYARLDEAALATAAATRFRPHTENGVPRAFWVVMPFVFELENRP